MTTLADLKTRIIAEMVRDDLSDTLAAQLLTHIQRACEYLSDERFWFNAIITTATTTGGSDVVSVLATVRRVDRVTIPAQYLELQEVQLGQIEQLNGTVNGIPDRYTYYNDQLKLYPTPDAVYTLNITGLQKIAAPVSDADSSVWTNEAQDAVIARTKFTLNRGQFRDPDGAQMALGEFQEALGRLKRETARRLRTPLRAFPPRPAFNIYRG